MLPSTTDGTAVSSLAPWPKDSSVGPLVRVLLADLGHVRPVDRRRGIVDLEVGVRVDLEVAAGQAHLVMTCEHRRGGADHQDRRGEGDQHPAGSLPQQMKQSPHGSSLSRSAAGCLARASGSTKPRPVAGSGLPLFLPTFAPGNRNGRALARAVTPHASWPGARRRTGAFGSTQLGPADRLGHRAAPTFAALTLSPAESRVNLANRIGAGPESGLANVGARPPSPAPVCLPERQAARAETSPSAHACAARRARDRGPRRRGPHPCGPRRRYGWPRRGRRSS